jgi:hypothetical protein
MKRKKQRVSTRSTRLMGPLNFQLPARPRCDTRLTITDSVESTFLLKIYNLLYTLVFQWSELGLGSFAIRDLISLLNQLLRAQQGAKVLSPEWWIPLSSMSHSLECTKF